jgi:NAD(P)H-dependent FMN reductase
MKVLGIVGSPHRDGLTNRLVQGMLEGAEASGAECQTMYLSDYNLKPCVGCQGATCWEDGRCRFDERAYERNRMLGEADAVVFGAPVYIHDINGLAKDFIDKVRVPPRAGRYGPFGPTNGKPAVGITVAGGTGKGVLASLQAVYYGFFFLCGFRALHPLPVTRFSLTRAASETKARGRGLVQAAQNPSPFEPEGLGDRMAYYQSIELVNTDPVGDSLYITQTIYDELKGRLSTEVVRPIEDEMRAARELIDAGRAVKAADPVWRAYLRAVKLWESE